MALLFLYELLYLIKQFIEKLYFEKLIVKLFFTSVKVEWQSPCVTAPRQFPHGILPGQLSPGLLHPRQLPPNNPPRQLSPGHSLNEIPLDNYPQVFLPPDSCPWIIPPWTTTQRKIVPHSSLQYNWPWIISPLEKYWRLFRDEWFWAWTSPQQSDYCNWGSLYTPY